MDFESPNERSIEAESGDRSVGVRNLMEVEDRIYAKMGKIASEIGGRYVSPSVPEIVSKINKTLDANPYVFYSVDENGTIWTVGGKTSNGHPSVKTYNESGNFGFIVRDKEVKENAEEIVRVYRGCDFDPKVKQVAPLARIEGLGVQDIYDYVDSKASMDDVIAKVKDPNQKEQLQYSINNIRKRASEDGTTELDEIKFLHTVFTSGALDIDLWVSAAYEPSEAYGHKNYNMGKIYGDFLTTRGIRSVLILDVPKSKLQDYKSEAGILGEIKPEYIRAIVPVSGNIEASVKRAEDYIEKQNK